MEKKEKNNEMFHNLETNCYLCTEVIKRKWQENAKERDCQGRENQTRIF